MPEHPLTPGLFNDPLLDYARSLVEPKTKEEFDRALQNPDSPLFKDLMNLCTNQALDHEERVLIFLEHAFLEKKEARQAELESKEMMYAIKEQEAWHQAMREHAELKQQKALEAIANLDGGSLAEKIAEIERERETLQHAIAAQEKKIVELKTKLDEDRVEWKTIAQQNYEDYMTDLKAKGITEVMVYGKMMSVDDPIFIEATKLHFGVSERSVDPVKTIEILAKSYMEVGKVVGREEREMPEAACLVAYHGTMDEFKRKMHGLLEGETGSAVLSRVLQDKQTQSLPFSEYNNKGSTARKIACCEKIREHAIESAQANALKQSLDQRMADNLVLADVMQKQNDALQHPRPRR